MIDQFSFWPLFLHFRQGHIIFTLVPMEFMRNKFFFHLNFHVQQELSPRFATRIQLQVRSMARKQHRDTVTSSVSRGQLMICLFILLTHFDLIILFALYIFTFLSSHPIMTSLSHTHTLLFFLSLSPSLFVARHIYICRFDLCKCSSLL